MKIESIWIWYESLISLTVQGFTDENAAWLKPSGQKRKLPLGGSDDEDEEEEDDAGDVDDESDDEAADGSDADSDDEEDGGDDDDDDEMDIEKQSKKLAKKQKKMLKDAADDMKINLAETEKFQLPSGNSSFVVVYQYTIINVMVHGGIETQSLYNKNRRLKAETNSELAVFFTIFAREKNSVLK